VQQRAQGEMGSVYEFVANFMRLPTTQKILKIG